uniref:Uncharacterized protein n=1 Tax=Knipowitschia caucasica TaxID=637954 RepID=A0AAV2KV08_KNICA
MKYVSSSDQQELWCWSQRECGGGRVDPWDLAPQHGSGRGTDGRLQSALGRSLFLAARSMLCLWVCRRVLSDCVYFSEGRFTSGSL